MANVRYPWGRWLAQREFRLHRGRDYHCQTHIMVQQLRNKASYLNLALSIEASPCGKVLHVRTHSKGTAPVRAGRHDGRRKGA